MAEVPEESFNSWESFCEHRGLGNRSAYAIGFNPHWRSTLARFIQNSKINHVRGANQVPAGAIALIWGRKDISESLAQNITLVRLEDGFLRSVGLGAQFAQPLSWVLDDQSLYFDATAPSRLESLLSGHQYTDGEKNRARNLLEQIRQAGISKYNTGSGEWSRPKTSQRVILVPGQVESDASIRFGAPEVNTNFALVKAVRQTNPDAWIIYKPHPDVVAGARKPGSEESRTQDYVDESVAHLNITALLDDVDEVHTMTSLTGFEAIIRNKPVTCYGLPFYAGWGLTNDKVSCRRRHRQLTLEELAYSTLVQYPLYVSRYTGQYTSPERILQELKQWHEQPTTWQDSLKKAARKGINLLSGAK
ncbi:hypothetical protein [Marinobacter sp. ATCH36]|uniref:capsular polysaccharide export protein, LipB/KpsS family n=1 Tax=Marinobacter sp. ATCH36 TaxID=2945106 RepID=UPI002021DFFC|nr:hypothetical protein [Marinobacter sp. ATCH36]